jgi:sulfur-oxidizing protein SoxX
MKVLIWFTSIILLSVLAACSYGPDSPKGFILPEGDIIKGEKMFMQYQCQTCHALKGYEDDPLIKEFDTPVPLGGISYLVKTYAQLVTSVNNPSYKLAPRSKPMKNNTLVMMGVQKCEYLMT